MVLYTGLQGGRYFLANRIPELGLLLAIMLFFYGAIVASLHIRNKDLKWNWWFFSTLFLVAYTFVLPGYVFSINADVPMLPSVLASRGYLIIFFGPALYFLYRIGFDVRKIERVFIVALVFLAINYMFHYFRLDLRATYFSADHTVASLVTHDDWRGYRLKPSSLALFTLSILAPFLMITSKQAAKKLFWLLIILILAYIWFLVKARSMAATLVLSSLMYPMFFAKKRRLALFFFALPIMLAGIGAIIMAAVEYMSSQAGGGGDAVRATSYALAINSLSDNPFLGFGQQSFYTKTEQDLIWVYFSSDDIGIMGVAFKYGLIGTFVYLFFNFFILQRLIKTIWLYKRMYGHINPVMFSVLIVFLALFINLALNPALARIDGMTLGGFAIGLTSAWRHKIFMQLKTSTNNQQTVVSDPITSQPALPQT
ncbi:MAG: hypothetical protein KJO69_02765 [Gammaproteobacteria bacterium]|nr:hypothetical protein [Gammaproteobacteria bacterium]